MKILILCHKTPYPANDGGSIASLAMVKGFAALGHRVTVLTMVTHKHNVNINGFPEIPNVEWETVWVNTRINPLELGRNLLFSKKPYNAVRFESEAFEQQLVTILNREKFDIIQLEGLYLTSYIPSIRKSSKALISLRAHNIESEIWQRQASESFGFKKWYFRILSKRIEKMEFQALQELDLLVPITKRDASILPFKNLQKVHVSPTGIESENCIQSFSLKGSKTVFYIGALDWQPNTQGLQWFIKSVWRHLSTKYPQWAFLIAGRNASTKFSKFLQHQPVKFVGQVENAAHFIDQGEIMVVPLFSGSGMRIKIIEGMARGKCIVTTPVGAEGIPVENQKHLFIAGSASEMIELLENLMSHPELVAKTGENALEFAKTNFNNQYLIGQLAQFYQQHLQ